MDRLRFPAASRSSSRCSSLGAAPVTAQSSGPVRTSATSPRPAEVAGIASPVLSLDGTWSFHAAPPRDFEKLTERTARGFAPIDVPGDWAMQGRSVTPWTAAGYLKTVNVPADWKGARIFLRSDGAQSLATFWVNGKLAREARGRVHGLRVRRHGALPPGRGQHDRRGRPERIDGRHPGQRDPIRLVPVRRTDPEGHPDRRARAPHRRGRRRDGRRGGRPHGRLPDRGRSRQRGGRRP